MNRSILAALAAASALAVSGAQAQPADAVHLAQDDLAWVEMAPGIEFAPAFGDWNAGAHGKFVRFAPGASVGYHTHSGTYYGVVISGRLTNPYPGEAEPPVFGPGDSWSVPGGAPHANACVSEDPCVLYSHADGAWDLGIVEDEAGED